MTDRLDTVTITKTDPFINLNLDIEFDEFKKEERFFNEHEYLLSKNKKFEEEIKSLDNSKQLKIIKLVKKRKEFNQPIKLETRA
jgi:hypothetical protein